MNVVDENEGIRVQKASLCPLCGREGILLYQDLRDRLFGVPGTWSLMRCPKCGLVWLNPRPIPEDIRKLYENYHTHSTTNQVPKLARLRSIIEESILATQMGYTELSSGLFQKMLGHIFSLLRPIKEMVELSVMTLQGERKGKLLDVGCGSGAFLSRMRELKWVVVGVELDEEAVKVARERFGINVYEGTLDEVSFPEDEFDAITMNHVIEHVYNPMTLLRECHRVLKPDGKLVITTPNLESLGHRLFGRAWRGLEVPRHFYLFSSRTLRVCAKQVGFRIKTLHTTARSARGMWIASIRIQRNRKLPSGAPNNLDWSLRLEGLTFQLLEHGLHLFQRNIGEEVVLIASKE